MSNMFKYNCPKCGDTNKIDICADVWVRLTENGTDADAAHCGAHIYEPESPARCGACGYFGGLFSFDPDMRAGKGGEA